MTIESVNNSDTSQRSSSTLPFGQPVALSSISGTAYVTAQLLVQQVAYKLSDKIFSYSPETFDLDIALKDWAGQGEKNIHNYNTSVIPLQTRIGAGALALGYIFSPDFDVAKRHIPQSLIAASGSLQQLRAALDQVSLLYGVSSPFVAHIAAADYSDDSGLVSDYDSALRLAEDLGLGLVGSVSAYEAQHMSIFSTLLASIIPTLHIYDGVRVARETLRVFDALGETAIADLFQKLSSQTSSINKRLDTAGKVVELLKVFNDELGTVYQPFEYYGHEQPDVVLVTFGSVESQTAKEVLKSISADGAKAGVVNVRIYRPFIEEAFLNAIPQSTRTIAVLGQVSSDSAAQSALYADVLAAVTFSGKFAQEPEVLDIKYTSAQLTTPQEVLEILHRVFNNGEAKKLHTLFDAQQYIFWDADYVSSADSASHIASNLAKDSKVNVFVNKTFDNLTQGGIIRGEIRASTKALEAPYEIEQANVVVIGDENILKDVDVLKSLTHGGSILIKLQNFKEEDIDKRFPATFRKAIQDKAANLYILNLGTDLDDAKAMLELAFFQISSIDISTAGLETPQLVEALTQSLLKIEVPATWAEIEVDYSDPQIPSSVQTNSFVPFKKQDVEEVLKLHDWQTVAKSFAFKEAFGAESKLRPDLSVKTSTITVKENRRLTPADYDRNIFHIEFDLGDSGLTYKIGEALGIHAENDDEHVNAFINFYGLNPTELVQVPAREDNSVYEVRTVFQALKSNVDILGKPPKKFYEALAEYATDETEKKTLEALGGQAGAVDFKKRSEVDTLTYVDILEEFKSAHPSFHDLVKIVSPLKRREYSIASAQAVTPNSVSLMIVVVDWVDTKGRKRYGHASHYLSSLAVGSTVTASVKPSVMKLPTKDTAPLIMAGLGTGLAPFRAFVQYRAMQKAQGKEIGSILLYLGSRHQREEYLYGEEWEAYLAAGVVTLIGSAFSRDQPQKIYIQDRMRQTIPEIIKAYIKEEGSFYLCGPTWPVPDVTAVLEEAIVAEAKASGAKKVDPKKVIEEFKEQGRYVLEVY